MKTTETVRYLSQYLKDNENEFLVEEIVDEGNTGYITIDRTALEKTIQTFYDSLP